MLLVLKKKCLIGPIWISRKADHLGRQRLETEACPYSAGHLNFALPRRDPNEHEKGDLLRRDELLLLDIVL
jgi:hypothetical protein